MVPRARHGRSANCGELPFHNELVGHHGVTTTPPPEGGGVVKRLTLLRYRRLKRTADLLPLPRMTTRTRIPNGAPGFTETTTTRCVPVSRATRAVRPRTLLMMRGRP